MPSLIQSQHVAEGILSEPKSGSAILCSKLAHGTKVLRKSKSHHDHKVPPIYIPTTSLTRFPLTLFADSVPGTLASLLLFPRGHCCLCLQNSLFRYMCNLPLHLLYSKVMKLWPRHSCLPSPPYLSPLNSSSSKLQWVSLSDSFPGFSTMRAGTLSVLLTVVSPAPRTHSQVNE